MSQAAKTVCVYAPCAAGGHARYTWELTTALARHPRGDYRFELVTCQDLDPAFRSNEYAIHAILPPLRSRSQFKTTLAWAANRTAYYPVRERAFLRWLGGRPDVVAVHLQEWKPWLATRLIRCIQALGKRVYYTVHNVLPHRYPPAVPRALMDHWTRRASLACDGLFVHTARLADELAEFLGTPHPPITVVPHGVWTVPDSDQSSRPTLNERLEWKRLLFFGAIRRNKGLDLLLRAAEHLPGYEVTIAGEPCEADYFHAKVLPRVRALRDAGRRVELIDRFVPDDEVGRLFNGHSVIVLPYTSEFRAQSGVVFLALAYGLPVVASRAGGLSDLLGEHPIGTTFETGSARGLATAVEELHSGRRRDEMARQMEAAARRFTWRAAAGATISGYSTATEAAPVAAAELNDDCALGTTPAR